VTHPAQFLGLSPGDACENQPGPTARDKPTPTQGPWAGGSQAPATDDSPGQADLARGQLMTGDQITLALDDGRLVHVEMLGAGG